MSAPKFVNHEVEVVLLLQTTREDVGDALARSGIKLGALLGECLIENIVVYSSEDDD